MILMMIMTRQTETAMTLTELVDQTGFIDLELKNQDIVLDSDIVLHIIDVKEIENIINEMTDDIILMKASNKDILQSELLEARNKLMTLIPRQIRQKRGLINAIGTLSKWTFGTMDDYDRQTIQKHFLQTDDTVNKQISINNHFNIAIEQIKNIVKNDRMEIEKSFNAINKFENQEYQEHMYLQQITKIQLIKSKIEQIQDNVVSAKYGLIHPNILTNNEITKYNIDFNKLKYLQLGIATFNNTYLILGIKIPKIFIQAQIRKIIPLPNKEQKEIDAQIEEVFTYKNKTMRFEENKHFRQLKPSTHCIITQNCKLVTNKDLEIILLDEKTIMVKNSAVRTTHIARPNQQRVVATPDAGTSNGNGVGFSFFSGKMRIAEMVQVPRGTIKNIIKRYTDENRIIDKPRASSKKLFSDRDERWIVNKCRSNPKLSAPNIRDLVAKHLQVNCHAETIRIVLHISGLHGRIARKQPFMSRNSTFLGQMVEEMCGEKQTKHLRPTVKHGGGHVMVLGSCSAAGVGNLIFIEGNMDKMQYLSILKDNLKQSAGKLGIGS
ncbi:uncharacterized protein LOC142233299 [Haematobia irritans]|uniref:uncharacterized protein LOC142233299 n=1 Tax=Haematobia irritans TaxID=7368 RepID=UPI003F50395A